MPLLAFIVALFIPRITIAILWFFTTWFEGVFNGLLIPILGFLFVPYTLLWYSVVVNVYGGQWGTWQTVVLVIAVLLDVMPLKRAR